MLFRLSRDERGFTMVTVIGALLVVTLLAVAGLSYAQEDLPVSAHERDRGIAYNAAEAGAQNYLYYLSQDPDYWTKCTNDTAAYTTPPQINQRWNGVGADPRGWAAVPGSANAFYTIELLPANGKTTCDYTNAEASMIDTTTGTFRIRATGRVGTNGVKRSIVVTLKRKSLLEYIYFTDKETRAPILYTVELGNRTTRVSGSNPQTIQQWAIANCDRYYGTDTSDGLRQNQVYNGEYQNTSGGGWTSFSRGCAQINFVDADVIAGPFHTNDEFLCIGSPDFGVSGQVPADKIETASDGQPPSPPLAAGYYGGTCSPNFIGTRKQNAAHIELPAGNDQLRRDTAAAYRFVGRTQLKLTGTTMNVIGKLENGTTYAATAALPDGPSIPIPPDGAVYVSNSAVDKPTGTTAAQVKACSGYDVTNAYGYQTNPADGCGNLEIQGNYSVNVTFGAENDIVVMDDITRPLGNPPSPDVLLGLISNNFIRVYHPVTNCGSHGCNDTDGCDNNGGPGAITIDAAILALKQSFMVDNYHCGNALGNLTIRGAIVQKFRGTVGIVGSSGYIKNYSYDRRLKYRSPPHFLNPADAAWLVQTYNEQVPAR